MPTRLIAFDLDGTLVDSLRDLAESTNALLAGCGAAPLDEAAIGRMVGDGAATLVRRAFEAAGLPAPDDALARFLRIYDARLLQWTRPYDGVSGLLEELTERRVPLAVLTNKPLLATRRVLEGLGLAEYFPSARVFGGDGPLPRKPDPAGLLALCAAVGAAPQDTILVGDSVVDWKTARAAGAHICLAAYGFGFQNFPREQLSALDRRLATPLDLLEAL